MEARVAPDIRNCRTSIVLSVAALLCVHAAAHADRLVIKPEQIRGAAPGQPIPQPQIASPSGQIEFEPHHVVVRFKPNQPAADIAAVHAAAGMIRIIETYRSVPGLMLIEIAPDTVQAAIDAYSDSPTVMYAEPDYHYYLQVIPNDSSFNQLWGLHNTGQTINGDPGTADMDVDGPQGWDLWTGSPDFVIADIDTGLLYTHPDMAANTWTNPGEIPGNGIDDDNNGRIDDIHGYDFINNDPDPIDGHGHGTHTAGTIGAVGNNGIGVAGVNWQCKIAAVEIFNAGGGTTEGAILGAFQYVINNQFKVSNNSWGGGGFSQAQFDMIAAMRNIGHIFVAAAGNQGRNNDSAPFYPASYNLDNIISVAAVNNDGGRAGFSNFGATSVDLGGPGVNVYSTYLNNGYAFLDGTSMASPHVCGVVALIWSLSPGLPWQQVRDGVFDSVRPLSSLNGSTVTGGMVNANAAVLSIDCNTNNTPDPVDVQSGTSADCNNNQRPDECEIAQLDCNTNNQVDDCEFPDCNRNDIPDACDVLVLDCNTNAIPDNCEPNDCNSNSIPDECDVLTNDCNSNRVPDNCEGTDCNTNGVRDFCELTGRDCDTDGIIDLCQLAGRDCNNDRQLDVCQLPGRDCNVNGILDTCEPDCNRDGIIDACSGSPDCNTNNLPDLCDLVAPPPIASTPNLDVPDNNATGVQDSIVVPVSDIVIRVIVTVNVPHTAISQLRLYLTHGTRTIPLWNNHCGQRDNLGVTFDDDGGFLNCLDLLGTYRPNTCGGGPLSMFNGMNSAGIWTLRVADAVSGQTGTFASWSIDVRTQSNPGVANSQDLNNNGIPDECDAAPTCATCRGDMNGDSNSDGVDIQPFVESLMGSYTPCADINSDGSVNSLDLQMMVARMLAGTGC